MTLAAFALAAALAREPESDWRYGDCRLLLTDLPASAPRFEQYRVDVERVPKPAAPRMGAADTRLFRTQLRTQAREGTNFAGHFHLAIWGCGAGCAEFAAVNLRTGAVAFPPGFRTINQIAASPLEPLLYRPDSRLMIVTGAPDEDFSRLEVRFLIPKDGRLKLIRRFSYADVCPPKPN